MQQGGLCHPERKLLERMGPGAGLLRDSSQARQVQNATALACAEFRWRRPARLVGTRRLADDLARHEALHDLRGAVADLEPDNVAQALLMRQVEAEAEMAVQEQALMDDLDREFRRPPFASRREPSVRLVLVAQP